MNAPVRPPVVFLMGPTAAGKTALALALHEHLPVDLVSVDAAQVYRGMDIGTAKPSRAERARAPHRLIDIRDPEEPYSAAAFRADAMREIADIHARGRIPLLVGGTLFYFHALEFGLPPTPAADPTLRAEIAREAAQAGWPALHARLARLDPARAARIHPHDAQRIQRALEICRLTGAPASAQARPAAEPAFEILRLALMPVTRGVLAGRIEARFHAMLRDGLIEEVKVLYQRGNLSPTLPSIRTVGYRQVWQYLDGAIDYNEMVSRAVYGTRQLAKRQLTWLRSYPGVQALKADDDAVVSRASALIRQMPEQRV